MQRGTKPRCIDQLLFKVLVFVWSKKAKKMSPACSLSKALETLYSDND